MEQHYGIPVALISAHSMILVAQNYPKAITMPIVFTPTPVIGVPDDKVFQELLEGDDPETGKPVIDGIIDALTRPQDNKKLKPAVPVIATQPREQTLTDTEDNLQQIFYERGWTDGLPVILPTAERVERMLKGTSHSPDEEVMNYDRDHHETIKYTVRSIAAIAVMAGARPEFLPVILAIASTRQHAIAPSTSAIGNLLLVNGPIRQELKMNSGIGAFSPINQANAVIGRAWTMLSICGGYAKVRKTLWSSQGVNELYNNNCIAENEERSVWTPFHVDKGFKATDSVISIFSGWGFINSIGCAANRPLAEELNRQFAAIPPMGQATIVMDPLVAANLKYGEYFETKLDFCKHLSETVKMKAGDYWKTDHISMLMTTPAMQGVEPYATWKSLPADTLIGPLHKPENINLIVTGGETSPLWKVAEYGYRISASVDKWR
jgi:hypothetical protein